LGRTVGNESILHSRDKIDIDALDSVLEILAKHEVIKSRLEQSLKAAIGLCEKIIIYTSAAQTGNDVSFCMGGIGLEALDSPGDDGVTCSHDHWHLLNEHGDCDQGHFGDRSVLCDHTFTSILGKDGGQATRLIK
jgi:hypothetical protein